MFDKEADLPNSFVARIKGQFPEHANQIILGLDSASITSIQKNILKPSESTPSGDILPWYEHGIILKKRFIFAADPLWHAGNYYVQEASSMFLGHVLSSLSLSPENLKVLDLCAAPGGKSHIIQNFLKDQGILWSNEIIPGRAAILRDNLNRYGHANTIISNSSPETLASAGLRFDIVVIDAPCSGEGMFRKDPGARKEWNPGSPGTCAIRQNHILNEAVELVDENGFLIYSTCTFAEEENEDQIAVLLATGEWESVEVPVDASWRIREISKNGLFAYQFFPGITMAGEGFFISVLKRLSKPGQRRPKRSNKPAYSKLSNKEADALTPWIESGKGGAFFKNNKENIFFFSKELLEAFSFFDSDWHVFQAGIPVGHMKGSSFIPEHALALSLYKNNEILNANLDLDSARTYLRGNDPGLHHFEGIGWHTVSCLRQALGWVKVMPNRVNNYYPKEQRLLHH